VVDDAEELLAFFDFPAEHWVQLRTSNPIESSSFSVRLRTRVTQVSGEQGHGHGPWPSRLLEAAQDRRWTVNGPHPGHARPRLSQVRQGVMVERPEEVASRS
jgi:putative transposase